MNLANKLTLLRVILIPFFIVCFYIPNLVVNTISVNNYLIPYANLLGLVIFLLAAITDFIDGYIARKYDLITDTGKMLDAIADKVLVNSVLIILAAHGFINEIIEKEKRILSELLERKSKLEEKLSVI